MGGREYELQTAKHLLSVLSGAAFCTDYEYKELSIARNRVASS